MAEYCIWDDSRSIIGPTELNAFTEAFFPDMGLEDALYPSLKAGLEKEITVLELFNMMNAFFTQVPDAVFDHLPNSREDYIAALHEAVAQVKYRKDVYELENKPNENGVFWPREEAFLAGEVTPFAKRHPIMDMSTVLSAAGSCFANEFSYAMQKARFNYLLKEPLWDGEDVPGLFNTSFHQNPDMPASSAQWGILFNTPGFTQLVERAFGERKFSKLLTREKSAAWGHQYIDPYREGIFFADPAIYEADYENHQAAVRETFLESEVFVFTPGLSECWEYTPDGTILSRNPRNVTLRCLCRPRFLSSEENIQYMQRFIDIARHYNPKLKFILSISPIPFLATTRGDEMHVVEANTLSKSSLRLAADHICRTNKDVFYFPSFELVTTVLPKPWEPDMRHVTKEAVGSVLNMFEKMFVE